MQNLGAALRRAGIIIGIGFALVMLWVAVIGPAILLLLSRARLT